MTRWSQKMCIPFTASPSFPPLSLITTFWHQLASIGSVCQNVLTNVKCIACCRKTITKVNTSPGFIATHIARINYRAINSMMLDKPEYHARHDKIGIENVWNLSFFFHLFYYFHGMIMRRCQIYVGLTTHKSRVLLWRVETQKLTLSHLTDA